MSGYNYDKNTDYSLLIDQAVRQGNMTGAAYYEQQRNAKIAGEGLEYQPTNKYAMYLQQQTQAQPTGYQSPYKDQINSMLTQLQGSQWSGWNKDEDESYKAYRKEYLREADRSMRDTLGEYAQNTGGIAGSSAITAASQAADYYKSQLADKVPELYQNAYSRYLNDISAKQQTLGQLMQADSQAQSQYNSMISAAMSKWSQLGYADNEVAGILGVAVGTPTSDQSYQNWSQAFQERQYADELAAAQAKAAQKTTGGSGGGRSGSSGSASGTDDYEGLFAAAKASGNPQSYIANHYKEYGFAKSGGLYQDYKNWAKNDTGMNESHFKASMQSISAQLKQGLTTQAQNNINRIYDELSVEQRQQLNELLDQYGLAME